MTENELMNVRNLTYLRAADTLISKITPSGAVPIEDLAQLVLAIERVADKLSAKLKVKA